jgi:hypothetical protein
LQVNEAAKSQEYKINLHKKFSIFRGVNYEEKNLRIYTERREKGNGKIKTEGNFFKKQIEMHLKERENARS